ncbi:hypothetical protein [Pseudoxanthomonas winnipegensis]|uniref:Uncharacterized protein n=1 Tax=Pseudoxanthomonas winnipegensis TaxID=2480810 RepID=A0A4Q8L5K0_9GAMM|nr:hypothetical protein [Pseudoxanthomonas winnipegensis]TAA20332.1 hypothetical protein EA660_18255 [Pseudoxanthomonas winnipegensis]
MNDWKHKDKWSLESRSFTIEVSRHAVVGLDAQPENIWCVYAYVYPKHPLFARFNPAGGMWEQPSLPGHSCVSYFRAHKNEQDAITSYQIGWDYNHDGDWRFTQMASKADAYEVFRDAEELFEHLASYEKEAA